MGRALQEHRKACKTKPQVARSLFAVVSVGPLAENAKVTAGGLTTPAQDPSFSGKCPNIEAWVTRCKFSSTLHVPTETNPCQHWTCLLLAPKLCLHFMRGQNQTESVGQFGPHGSFSRGPQVLIRGAIGRPLRGCLHSSHGG